MPALFCHMPRKTKPSAFLQSLSTGLAQFYTDPLNTPCRMPGCRVARPRASQPSSRLIGTATQWQPGQWWARERNLGAGSSVASQARRACQLSTALAVRPRLGGQQPARQRCFCGPGPTPGARPSARLCSAAQAARRAAAAGAPRCASPAAGQCGRARPAGLHPAGQRAAASAAPAACGGHACAAHATASTACAGGAGAQPSGSGG